MQLIKPLFIFVKLWLVFLDSFLPFSFLCLLSGRMGEFLAGLNKSGGGVLRTGPVLLNT